MTYAKIIEIDSSLIALHDDAKTKAEELDKIVNGNDVAKIDNAKEDCDDAVAVYNSAAMKATFKAWLNTDDAIKSALSDGYLPIVKMSIKKLPGTDEKTVEFSDERVVFSISDFVSYAKRNGYPNPVVNAAWYGRVEECRKVFTGYMIAGLKSEKASEKYLAEFHESATIDAGDENCHESDFKARYTLGSCDRAFQYALDAVIFNDPKNGGKNSYQVRTNHRNYILAVLGKMGKTIASVKFAKPAEFVNIFTNIAIAIVTKAEITTDYYIKTK